MKILKILIFLFIISLNIFPIFALKVNIPAPTTYGNYSSVNTNASEYADILITVEGFIDNVIDILGSQITNDLNWISTWLVPDLTSGWLYNDSTYFYLNQSKFDTIYYNATTSIAIAGTIDGGTIEDTQHDEDNSYDGVTFNFSEEAGSPGLDLRVNFTNVITFNRGFMRYKTSSLSGDAPIIQLWNYDKSIWEDYPKAYSSIGSFDWITQPVTDTAEHIGAGDDLGIVQMRLYKASNGNTNNHYYVDWIALSNDFGGISGSVNLDEYWKEGDTEETGNFTTSGILNVSTLYVGNANVSGILSDISNNNY